MRRDNRSLANDSVTVKPMGTEAHTAPAQQHKKCGHAWINCISACARLVERLDASCIDAPHPDW